MLTKRTENKGVDYECIIATDNIDKISLYRGCYKLIFVIAGELGMRLNSERFTLEEQGYMIVKPTDKCAFLKSAKPSKVLFIDAAEEEILKALNFLGDNCERYITMQDKLFVNGDYNVKLKIDELYNRILKHGDKDHLLSKLITLEMLSGMARVMHRSNYTDVIPKHIVQAVNGLKNLENLQIGVKYVERELNYSRSQLCRIFKKYYGKTPFNYVAELRLSYAYNMIIYTDYDFDTIAEAVGFASISHFYEKFKLQYKTTPSKLRITQKKGGEHEESDSDV